MYDYCQQAVSLYCGDRSLSGTCLRRSGFTPWRADGLGFTWHSSGEEAPVATGPEDYAAVPDGHGRLRASRADREQAIGTLKAAFVQGRLTKDELDERVGRALIPLTYAELAALTGDLPDGLTAARRPRGDGHGKARLQESRAAKAGVFAGLVVGVAVVADIGNSENPLQVLAAVLLLSPVWLLALAGLLFLHAR